MGDLRFHAGFAGVCAVTLLLLLVQLAWAAPLGA